MTRKAVDRLGVVQQVVEQQLRQKEAARQLGLSVRQVKRLVARYRAEGPSGLVSRRLGRRPGNALSDAARQEALGLVRTHYPDFGPTLAREKLAAHHGHKLSAETARAYMETLRAYLTRHGRPVALYSDKHSIFRVNRPDREGELTQFARALRTLDIEPIHANTPQAKGRVERANQTLQDRLVKELRLVGISDSVIAAWPS